MKCLFERSILCFLIRVNIVYISELFGNWYFVVCGIRYGMFF